VKNERAADLTPEIFKPLTTFVDTWANEAERNHLSILGDFGSGKTWFCQHYAYLAAKRYLADSTHHRIPILISLRNYSRAYDVEQLITDAIINRYGIALAAGYKTFATLNKAGRLLIIFDGFDEMEQRVNDYRTTVENFWELAKVAYPASKVLLTCRIAYFRHRREEKRTLSPQHNQVNVAAGDRVINLHSQGHFEVVYLQKFSYTDIRMAIQKRLPDKWEPVFDKITRLSNLHDLASRPVLLDMIAKTLPQIEDASQINQATLYEIYLDTLMHRRWNDKVDYISPENRLFFMQELAWEMFTTQRLTISFSEFPERVKKHFNLQNNVRQGAFFERDIRSQSYLVRDNEGNYRFAHKSFMEYFVARKLVFDNPDFDLVSFVVEELVEGLPEDHGWLYWEQTLKFVWHLGSSGQILKDSITRHSIPLIFDKLIAFYESEDIWYGRKRDGYEGNMQTALRSLEYEHLDLLNKTCAASLDLEDYLPLRPTEFNFEMTKVLYDKDIEIARILVDLFMALVVPNSDGICGLEKMRHN
jgi:hypothetical protein